MDELNNLLHELGISKVKLAKFLGVSRQMIYNYLELDDVNKWPKDKKVLLFNLLGIKSYDEMKKIKVDTDYIMDVEIRLNSINERKNNTVANNDLFGGLDEAKVELLTKIIDIIREYIEDDDSDSGCKVGEYLFHFIQSLNNNDEIKYLLGYVVKETGYVKPDEFIFDDERQYIFESILFTAMALYHSGKASKSRLIEAHRRFETQINNKIEEKMSRTMELNSIKQQALKELGFTEINDDNISQVFAKIAEIQSRKNAFK